MSTQFIFQEIIKVLSQVIIIVIIIYGKRKDELRSYSLCTYNVDVLLMCLDYLLCDGKAESCALFILASRQVRLIESVPYKLKTLLWYPYTAVLD